MTMCKNARIQIIYDYCTNLKVCLILALSPCIEKHIFNIFISSLSLETKRHPVCIINAENFIGKDFPRIPDSQEGSMVYGSNRKVLIHLD